VWVRPPLSPKQKNHGSIIWSRFYFNVNPDWETLMPYSGLLIA
jgi:hypothetical protein